MSTTADTLPVLLEQVEVRAVERLSPSFVRIELGAPALRDFGVAGDLFDQRIKLVFPDPGGPTPSFEGADASWYTTWLERPVAERGHMRTYTVREVRGQGEDTRLVVDFVLHAGAHGPGGDWGARAAVGDRIAVIAPRRGHVYGGIEFAPGEANRLLLVGDETAVPAVAAILEQLPDDARGAAFLEVPATDDVLDLRRPPGVSVTWLPRDAGAEARGVALQAAVLAHLDVHVPPVVVAPDEVDQIEDLLWETPEFSGSGESLDAPPAPGGGRWQGCYFWIAGESRLVTGLRRVLVKELGVDRHQVCFMGYWREGVAMRS